MTRDSKSSCHTRPDRWYFDLQSLIKYLLDLAAYIDNFQSLNKIRWLSQFLSLFQIQKTLSNLDFPELLNLVEWTNELSYR